MLSAKVRLANHFLQASRLDFLLQDSFVAVFSQLGGATNLSSASCITKIVDII